VLEKLGRAELIDNEEEAWNIRVNCDTGVSSSRPISLKEWLHKCRNTSCRYVLCTYVCTDVCLGFVMCVGVTGNI
jgi:hypothetical protein